MPRDSRKTRKKILEASIDLLQKDYSPEIGMADFARHADVSRQTLYVQFTSRGKLLSQAFRYLNEDCNLQKKIDKFKAELSGKELISELVVAFDEHYEKVFWVAKALLASLELEPEARSAWHEWMDIYRQLCSGFIKTLKSDELLEGKWSIGTSTDLLMSLLSLENWSFLRKDCAWTSAQYGEHLSGLLLSTFTYD